MTEVDIELKTQVPVIPDHWSLLLKCTICFGYFREPHTLGCGHSFCRRCLKRLAEIAKEDNPDVRVRHLTLTCPACRHPFPAKPALADRLSTSIVLKQLVELWRAECSLLASCSPLKMRSVHTQTYENEENVFVLGSESVQEIKEEFTVRLRPLEQYMQAVMQRVTESTEDLEQDLQQDSFLSKRGDTANVVHHIVSAVITPYPRMPYPGLSDTSSDSDASSISLSTASRRHGNRVGGIGRRRGGGRAGSDHDIDVSSTSSVSIPDLIGRVGVLTHLFDLGPARLLLLLVWCMYSVVIVGLAESFLPYVILFTLFFFLIVLR